MKEEEIENRSTTDIGHNIFVFCLVLKTDDDLPILFLKEWHLSAFLFCDDTNVNTAIPPKCKMFKLSYMIIY